MTDTYVANHSALQWTDLDEEEDLDSAAVQLVSKLLSSGLQDKLTTLLEGSLTASAAYLCCSAQHEPQQAAGLALVPQAVSNSVAYLMLWQGAGPLLCLSFKTRLSALMDCMLACTRQQERQ